MTWRTHWQTFRARIAPVASLAGLAGLAALPAVALDDIRLRVTRDSDDLRPRLSNASLLRQGETEFESARDIYAAALADYRRLTEALYSEGYYSGVISITLDGREASEIAPLSVPRSVDLVTITVDPGRSFRFGDARIAPLAPGTERPEAFRTGERARADVLREVVETAIRDWRDEGHARAALTSQSLVANHARRRLDAEFDLDPGRKYVFGALIHRGESAVRDMRIRRIGGLPEGEVFSVEALEDVVRRLRRTGAFASVTLEEEPADPDGNVMNIIVKVADEEPRRFGFGAELFSREGLELSAFWFHRNLLGGAERFRVDGAISNINGDTSGIDYSAGARITTPGRFGADTVLFAFTQYEFLDEADYTSENLEVGVGATRYISEGLEAELGFSYTFSETEDDLGRRSYEYLSYPLALIWDGRDDTLDPREGHYVRAGLRPFTGLGDLGSGVRGTLDARGYLGVGAEDRFVLAARLQFGAVAGPELVDTPRDFLFYSGGGGTVRGQPYQSLGVDLGGGVTLGGRSFLGLSGELRADVSDALQGVVFADAGYIGAEEVYDGSGEWHSGAGLGLRYKTAIGPIRLDLATPLDDETDERIQFYIGIGQAF
ncbi:autotransporter assembly complex protein TamA [Poseidonocella sedimentorum]|uniref:Autotransporter secretion outer membrane protein TamA n=1 Tax=Poseidonocella sedimentorum TaxID=871652 RepID=A0A1I6D392_9RHOB|nr:autotransporter assembly complex family protein [Poseidonocella sedimentorum]SFQ99777.1 autotransporter secretion outer membrane protein TamA [Poseidonocella sedimentorum]